eukprot:TRINITY_DN3201_c0_g2_i1.p1 TRINITY_DN3201_c0_g2~~TRINITY_DN3201_c0_g2_i1.p1  ORF type:complete len:329 (-),score=99.77 TRINITY_DN3201_c0_g2_i1:359-1345(-)
MQALLLHEADGLDTMTVETVELPIIQNDELLIKVHSCGLNPVDWKVAKGKTEITPPGFILGLDVAGTIENIGSNVVYDFKKGDRVCFHHNLDRNGGFAEYIAVPAIVVAKIPDSLSFSAAASLLCAGLTAYQSIFRRLQVKKDETILIEAAAGGVGGFAVQLAKLCGATVIGTASSQNIEYCKNLGVDFVIDYRKFDVNDEVNRLTNNRGVDCMLECISGDNATNRLNCLGYAGRIATLTGNPDMSTINVFARALTHHAIALGSAYGGGNNLFLRDLSVMASELMELVVEGKVQSTFEELHSLEDVPDGLKKIKQGHVRGKLVVKICE